MTVQSEMKKPFWKKAIAFLMIVCMLSGFMVPLMSITASAAAPTSYTTITTNSTASVSITSSGGAKYFKFVPTQSGDYKFYSSSASGDPYVELLDASGAQLAKNDDGASNYNFSLTYACTENTTYYIKARMYSSSGTGSYTLNVQTVSVVVPACAHQYVNDVCTKCGHSSLDNDQYFAVKQAGGTAYTVFVSGRSGSGSYYSSNHNHSENSLTNGGYDLYSQYNNSDMRNITLGRSFEIFCEISELAELAVYAFDIDESSGEKDRIYLVDETAGTRVALGLLSGMDWSWNNTTFRIDPSNFTVGHTYHFELTHEVSGWVSYVRNVTLTVNGTGGGGQPIESASATASIDRNNTITVNATAKASATAATKTYTIEIKATALSTMAQHGQLLGASMSVSPTEATRTYTFSLESGAPEGTYSIEVFWKDPTTGTVVKSVVTTSATPHFAAVAYHANGGSNNIPLDTTSYVSGDTVTVKFDYTPSRADYIFLGWARSNTATTPDYTENGTKTFTIGSTDVTLYAVWAPEACEHTFTESSRTPATCTGYGEVTYSCSCGESYSELLEPTGHNYQITNTVEPTCTTDGYIAFTCQSGCGATKQQTLSALGHDFVGNICYRCGYEINPHTHEYDVFDIVDATCTTMGYTVYSCACGHSYRGDYVEPTSHDWDSGVMTIEKTCTTQGLKTYTCQNCSATKTEILPAGHVWNETVTLEKTCTTDGSKTKTCEDCGATETEVIPAGHNWDAGTQTLAPTCTTEGSKTCTCADCGTTEAFAIPKLGHEFVNGVCSRCGIRFIEIVDPSAHPLYGMYFEIDDILSDYGPSLIDEYGVMLDYNSGANLEKVAVYLTQDGTMWRRCIAVKGTGITHATYVPYLSYQSDIKYTGLNHDWINIFRLSENSDGIWCYSNYATIGVNLQDAYGNLLLSLYDIGQAGAETRIFDDLDEMIAWLNDDDTCAHATYNWIVEVEPTCKTGLRHKKCADCGKILEVETMDPTSAHTPGAWIVDAEPSATQTGLRHRDCTVCGETIETEIMPVLAKLVIANVEAEAGSTVRVTLDIQNNPGIIGALLTINYDPALTLIRAEAGGAWSSLDLTKPSTYTNPCNFVWDGVGNADFSNGTIIVLTFEVAEDAEPDTVYAIRASYTPGNLIDSDLEPTDAVIENGSITVIDTLGDVNDDGIVDVADVITLRRYLAGGYGVTIDEEAADMNEDGVITVVDIVLLRQFIVR